MESEELKIEMREGFRETRETLQELAKSVQRDHDVLLRLDQQFTLGFSSYSERVKDHETRLRFLERVAFGMITVVLVVQFVIGVVSKFYSK